MPFTSFPLHGIIRDAAGVRCACPDPKCTSIGKHPAVAWSRLGAGEEQRGSAGHGIATGWRSDVFVIDLDSDAANEAFNAMGDVPDTYTVKTARGWHLYFKWPGFGVRTAKNVFGPGIDVRGDGGYVVAPNSPHASGATYEVDDDRPVAVAPKWLLDRPELKGSISNTEGSDNAPTPIEPTDPIWDARVNLGIKNCQEWEPSGGTTFFRLALRLVRDLQLPLDKCHQLVTEHYNPRAVSPDGSGRSDPWSDKDINHKLVQARDNSTIKPGDATPLQLQATNTSADAWLANIEKASIPKPFLTFGGWDKNPPPVEFLVEGLLPKGSISKWFGHADSLKTWLLFSLAIAVSRGVPWLGKYPTKRCRVAIIDYETGRNNLHRRLHMLGAGDNDWLGATSMPPEKTTDEALWQKLMTADVGLVIVDSLRAGDGELDENSSKEAIKPLIWAARFAEHTGASVAFIHHARKSNSGEIVSRGSAAIKDQVDCAYVIKAEGGEDKRRITLSCEKPGDMRKPKDVELDVVFDDSAHKVTMTAIDAVQREVGESQYDILHRRGPFPSLAKLADALFNKDSGPMQKKAGLIYDSWFEEGSAVHLDGKYQVDTAEARAARILACAKDAADDNSKLTVKAFAAKAKVNVHEVERALALGQVGKHGSGTGKDADPSCFWTLGT